jgi:uncharacterized protein
MLRPLLLALQLQVPAPTGYVNDFAGVIDPDSRREMLAIIDEVRQKSMGEIVVVTLRDLGGRPSIDLARDIGRQWKVGAMGGPGERARNAGIILLFKPGARPGDGQADVAIATGSGAEGFVTDAQAGRIREAIGRRAVETGRYASGLTTGVALIAQAYAREFGFELSGASQAPVPSGDAAQFPKALILVVVFFVLLMMVGFRRGLRRSPLGSGLFWMIMSSRRGRGGMWSGGGGGWGGGGGRGGGFGGFGGGGGFSGGGASGRF